MSTASSVTPAVFDRLTSPLPPSADTASNAQILFLVLNASSLTLLPVSIFMYRAQAGAHDPTLVFVPILLIAILTIGTNLFTESVARAALGLGDLPSAGPTPLPNEGAGTRV